MADLTPLLTACPTRDVQIAGDQYAADLTDGLERELATPQSAAEFLDSTFLTRATADFLRMATARLNREHTATSPSVYQLYNRYGGGKTHSLLLLAAAARHPELPWWRGVAGIAPTAARVVAFDGAKHGVTTGAELGEDGSRAYSLAGFLLYELGNPSSRREYQAFVESGADRNLLDPGAGTLQRLIGDEPTLIIIDELVQYISRVNQYADANSGASREGALTTISAIADAVANCPNAALVITSPEDAHGVLKPRADEERKSPADAFRVTEMLERINSQLARYNLPLAPSGASDLPEILRKRLFRSIDETARQNTAHAYAGIAGRNGRSGERLNYQAFYDAYPFHPALIGIITDKMSANTNFQRARGTLRLMVNTLLEIQNRDPQAFLVHPCHVTPEAPAIRDELINRQGFEMLDPAIESDILAPNSAVGRTNDSLAGPVAVTMLLGSIAPDSSSGLYTDEIAEALLSPRNDDFGVIAEAVNRFLSQAIYLDDSLDTQRKRFSKEANVMKELIAAKDAIGSSSDVMAGLFQNAVRSAYGGNSRQADRLEIVLFPSRESNLPDDPRQAALGIINPEHWNWTDAGNASNGMHYRDLLEQHRHSSANNGSAARQYPNNALLLAAHDANLALIREDLALMEAADRLLKNPSGPLAPHRRDTLESVRANAEKNATVGIQSKFTHLFSAGNSVQHQWPEANTHLEHRTLESMTDAVGKGQDAIFRALEGQILKSDNAGLHKEVWAGISSIANEKGSTLGELREHFARTPQLRIVLNQAVWQAMIADGVKNEALHLETLQGEINPAGYDAGWRVWVKGFEPPPPPPPPPPNGHGKDDTHGVREDKSQLSVKSMQFTSDSMPGRAAWQAVREFAERNQHDWAALASCRLQGANPALADQVASIAQGGDQGIAITLKAQNAKLQLAIIGAAPSEFKDYANSVRRIMDKAGAAIADIDIQLPPEIARGVLEKLNNQVDATIHVSFRDLKGT